MPCWVMFSVRCTEMGDTVPKKYVSFKIQNFEKVKTKNKRMLNSSHKCNRPSHLRNYDPKFNKSIFLGSQIA